MTDIALITGGSRGIGKSTALLLAERGIDVVLTYVTNEKEALDVVRSIRERGRNAIALRLDLGATSSFATFADDLRRELQQHFGRPTFDFLVNNAGVGHYASFDTTAEDDFDRLVDVHFKGVFFLTQKLLPLISDGGRIVNLSTGLARYVHPGLSVYSAVKAAIESVTRSLAVELGPRRISVNVVAPGGVVTDFGGGAMRDPTLQDIVLKETPLAARGHIGQPEDIAGVIASLLHPDTAWITGQRIEVTGGYRL